MDITPDKTLLEKLGSVGFHPEEALSEFVDNAIDAKYDDKTGEELIQGILHVRIDIAGDRIVVQDDSAGIKDFDNCLRTAWSEKTLDRHLGSYGLGLKTASMSLGRKLTIISKRIHSSTKHTAILDLDTWYSTPEWNIEVIDSSANPESHGTELSIEKLHVVSDLLEDGIYEGLSARFSPFISENIIEIRLNSTRVLPEDIHFMKSTDPRLKDAVKKLGMTGFEKRANFKFEIDDMEVEGWIDLLDRRSVSGNFGFHLFRGKRLIEPYSKIGVFDHPSYSNIFGHIYLPRKLPVSFTKNKIETQRPYYRELKRKMEKVAEDHRKVALQIAKEHLPMVTAKVASNVLKSIDAVTKAIENSKLIQSLFEEEKKRSTQETASAWGEVDSEVRRTRVKKSIERPIPKNITARNPKPNSKTQKKDWWNVNVGGFKLKLLHEWIESDEDKMYYSTYDHTTSPPELLVTTNTRFDAYAQTTDKIFYATSNVVMALSQLIVALVDPRKLLGKSYIEVQEDIWVNWARSISSGIGEAR